MSIFLSYSTTNKTEADIIDAFLKSRWCMYEVLKLMQDRDFKKKIIPFRIEDARIFSLEKWIDYFTF